MTVKRLPGTFGVGIIWDEFTRSLIVAIPCPGATWKFHFPRAGACKNCGHGPISHTARRDHGFVEWACGVLIAKNIHCDCTHYDPESR